MIQLGISDKVYRSKINYILETFYDADGYEYQDYGDYPESFSFKDRSERVLFFEIDEKPDIYILKMPLKALSIKYHLNFHIAETDRGYHIIALRILSRDEHKKIFQELKKMHDRFNTDYLYRETNLLRLTNKSDHDITWRMSIFGGDEQQYWESASEGHYIMFRKFWKNFPDIYDLLERDSGKLSFDQTKIELMTYVPGMQPAELLEITRTGGNGRYIQGDQS